MGKSIIKWGVSEVDKKGKNEKGVQDRVSSIDNAEKLARYKELLLAIGYKNSSVRNNKKSPPITKNKESLLVTKNNKLPLATKVQKV